MVTPPPRLASTAEARQNLDSVLAGKEFQGRHNPVGALQRFIRNFLDALGRILPESWVEGLRRPATYVVGLLALLLAGYLLYTLNSLRRGKRATEWNEAADETKEPEHSARTRAEALQALGRGDLQRFILLYYRSFLLTLDENNILRYQASRTNWECWREIRRGDGTAATDSLKAANQFYDSVIFGKQPASGPECEAYRQSIETAAQALKVPFA